jgi:hypothetical protein
MNPLPVILSAAKNLILNKPGFLATLRMTVPEKTPRPLIYYDIALKSQHFEYLSLYDP